MSTFNRPRLRKFAASFSGYVSSKLPTFCHTPNSRRFLHTSEAQSWMTLSTCPPATCACREMPLGLDINQELPLANTMPAYHKHLVIPTGRSDWTSRIEDDEGLRVVKEVKQMLGPKGEFSNPFHNVMMTASSHTISASSHGLSAILLPDFQYVTTADSSTDNLCRFIQAFVLPSNLDSRMPNQNSDHVAKLKQKPNLQSEFDVTEINDISVLICGHNARDSRCGVLGPILQKEFEDRLNQTTYMVKKDWNSNTTGQNDAQNHTGSTVAQISHIGGHKFAGNIIIYIPPTLTGHPLAGKGIWYGRVEPKHVEGIVKKTIEEGVIIQELFRGGIGRNGEMIRL